MMAPFSGLAARLLAPKVLVPLVAAGMVLSGAAGYKVRGWQCEASKSKAIERGREREQGAQANVDDVSERAEEELSAERAASREGEAQVRIIYRDLPAPPARCLPHRDALSVLEGALDRANASASGEPLEQLRGPASSAQPIPRP